MLRKILIIFIFITLGFIPMITNADDSYSYSPYPDNSYAPYPDDIFGAGIYLGIQGGYGMTHWNNLENHLTKINYKVRNENGIAGRIFVGLDLYKHLAIEGGFTNFFNEVSIKPNKGKIHTYVGDLVGKIKLPISSEFGFYTKIGADYLYTSKGINGNSRGAINLAYGVGVNYNLSTRIITDLSWTRFNGSPKLNNNYQPDVDLFAVGIYYIFDAE